MKPTFHDRGAKLEWMDGNGKWNTDTVVSKFFYEREELIVIIHNDQFRIISFETGETRL